MRAAKATTIMQILTEAISTRWGTPAFIISDRGTQFTSNLLAQLCKQWQVTQKLTSAYLPQSNLTERVNWNLKTMIAMYVEQKFSQSVCESTHWLCVCVSCERSL